MFDGVMSGTIQSLDQHFPSRDSAPVMFDFLFHSLQEGSILDHRDFLLKIKALATCNSSKIFQTKEFAANDPEAMKFSTDEMFLRTGEWFIDPLNVKRLLPCHPRDASSSRYDEPHEECLCNKTKMSGSGWTAGLMLVFCAKHGCCIGMSLLDMSESPRAAFEILYTRWPHIRNFEERPVVFYDNVCNLHRFCNYRESSFFEYFCFLLDRFHASNHVYCSPAFNPSLYTSAEIQALNSQAAEQGNSDLHSLDSHLGYMTQANFLFNIRSQIFRFNLAKRVNMQDPEFNSIEDFFLGE